MSILTISGPMVFSGKLDGNNRDLQSIGDVDLKVCVDPVSGISFSVEGELETVTQAEPPVSFDMVAGIFNNPIVYGYVQSQTGTVSDDEVFGETLYALISNNAASDITLHVLGNLPDDFFTSLQVSGNFTNGGEITKTLLAENASVSRPSGLARTVWTWPDGSHEFKNLESYSCLLTR